MYKTDILLGKWTQEALDRVLRNASEIKNISKRIDFLSGQFINLDYRESTLTGDVNIPEVFTIDLEGVDCFTFIDYIEAMRLSASFSEFTTNLKKVRYRSGRVSFKERNHFFTDWIIFNLDFVEDVTCKISGKKFKRVTKTLNKKENRTYFLPGIKPVERETSYIPSDAIDNSVLSKLRTGDYIGIYSTLNGLDVSHAGIIIKHGKNILLRHASSAAGNRKVVDEDFKKYIADKPGIIVLRTKSHKP